MQRQCAHVLSAHVEMEVDCVDNLQRVRHYHHGLSVDQLHVEAEQFGPLLCSVEPLLNNGSGVIFNCTTSAAQRARFRDCTQGVIVTVATSCTDPYHVSEQFHSHWTFRYALSSGACSSLLCRYRYRYRSRQKPQYQPAPTEPTVVTTPEHIPVPTGSKWSEWFYVRHTLPEGKLVDLYAFEVPEYRDITVYVELHRNEQPLSLADAHTVLQKKAHSATTVAAVRMTIVLFSCLGLE